MFGHLGHDPKHMAWLGSMNSVGVVTTHALVMVTVRRSVVVIIRGVG